MQTSGENEIVAYSSAVDGDYGVVEYIQDMADSVREVEQLLNYRFEDKNLLEEALTHASYTNSASYQRLEFIGAAALGLAISNFHFRAYPDLDPGQLTRLRDANISTEKLARVAVRHGLHCYVRHNAAALDEKVKVFALAVQQDTKVYGGTVTAPKVLADIVESVAAAVFIDCHYDLQALWLVFRGLMEPIVMLDDLQQQPHPVTMLFEMCQKDGKQVDIRHWRRGDNNIASVYVNGKFVASGSSEQKQKAKFHAAKAALEKLSHSKQRLLEICDEKGWSKPSYRIEKEVGPAHERKFICSVQIETADNVLFMAGDERLRVKDAEYSAASLMICELRKSKHISNKEEVVV